MRGKFNEMIAMSILCESDVLSVTDFSTSCLFVPEAGFDAANIEKLQNSLIYKSALYFDAINMLH